jgi:hypothetical protein
VYATATDSRDLEEVCSFAFETDKLLHWLEQHTFEHQTYCLCCLIVMALHHQQDEVFAAATPRIVGIACTVGTVFVASRDDVFFAAPLSSPSGMGFWSLASVALPVSSALSLSTLPYRQHCRYNRPYLRRCLYRRHCRYNPLSSDWMWLGSYLSSSSLSAFP